MKVVAAVVPNFTAVAPVNDVPVTTAMEFGSPIAGVKFVILGNTIKLAVLVPMPAALVALTFPVIAPVGTFIFICVAETGVIVPVLTVPDGAVNSTSVTLFKFEPLIVTVAPTAPMVGENDVMVGGLMTINMELLVDVPVGAVTLIVPVLAVAGTVAVI